MSATARHEWIDTWCTHLQSILHAPAATHPADGARLVTLPTWLWLAPAIDMGRKAVRADGRSMLMPVRITWGAGDDHVLSLATGAHQLHWSATGMGHSATGTVTVIVTDAGITHDADRRGLEPVDVGADNAHTRATLAAAAADARWGARMSLEWYVERAVQGAVRVVARDILGVFPGAALLDEHSIEQVRDTMLLGTETAAGAVDRIIDRSLARGAFVNVDPLRYITTDLQRSAEAYVRRAISDPPIGRKIRRVARSMPGASLADIVTAYREVHPGDFLSVQRAARALTAGPDLNATATRQLLEESLTDRAVVDVEDLAVAQADAAARLATVRTLATASRSALRTELDHLRLASWPRG